ncbi:MAG: OPT/YSL family transporter [Puniceicoccales bacterium]|jgi:OPT family oligopeptide transporter|nr:OPT/YSL family transporter [Puniceicoccales bacterium]
MPVCELNEDQIKTWTRTEKDKWWLENVFRGNLPQLTWRSALTGFLLGGVLSATNLYIGAKSGVTLGVGLTSVILAFALFKMLVKAGITSEFSILENNAMQSIATAAGYMTSPLISSLAALMLMTDRIIPWWQMILWNCVISILGVLVAFPMKRRFINDDQMPFPEGRACGVVLDTLYTSNAGSGIFKAKVLATAAAISAVWQFLISEGWMRLVQFKLLALDKGSLALKAPWYIRERLDEYYYLLAEKYNLWTPRILGTDARDMGLRVSVDAAMIGVGGLMGLRTSSGVLIGALLNFALLGPLMIHLGEVIPGSGGKISRGEFVNQWGLWWAVTAMVIGSVFSLFAKPKMFTSAFSTIFRRRASSGKPDLKKEPDVLARIELPLWVSYVGIPIFGFLGAWMAHEFFGANWWLVAASVPLTFILSIIAANAMALTAWTPIGALSKITQFTMGAIDHTNAATNLSTAGMTGEVAGNAANLLSDIKPGYMLGAKPRQQAIGHIIGILSGAIASTPIFYILFLPKGNDGTRSLSTLVSEQFPMPGAKQWEGVARLIEKGLSALPPSVLISMLVAAVIALVFEVLRITTRGRFPLSGITVGLGAVLPPDAALCMFVGALAFHFAGNRSQTPGTRRHLIWVECLEPICAGLITGAALIGIGNAICNVLLG